MSLTEAISFLRDACDRTGSGVAEYVFHEGHVYARSPAILACHPVDLDGTFALPADDLDKALARLGDDPIIEAGEDGKMVLKKGRLRAALTVLATDPPHKPEIGTWQVVPAGLQNALKLALPFVSPEGTWQRGVRFTEGRVSAINNRSAIDVDVPLPAMEATLDAGPAAYIAGLPAPIGWVTTENSFTFGWASGAWVRCQLLSTAWSPVVDDLVARAGDHAPIALDIAWQEAVEHLSVLGSGVIRVMSTGLKGSRDHSDSKVRFETGVVKATSWHADVLKQMLAIATAWNPDADGRLPARFVGPGVRGIVMRRSG